MKFDKLLLCYIGFHDWDYDSGDKPKGRYCMRCHKKEEVKYGKVASD